jgi:hypothetical protein
MILLRNDIGLRPVKDEGEYNITPAKPEYHLRLRRNITAVRKTVISLVSFSKTHSIGFIERRRLVVAFDLFCIWW